LFINICLLVCRDIPGKTGQHLRERQFIGQINDGMPDRLFTHHAGHLSMANFVIFMSHFCSFVDSKVSVVKEFIQCINIAAENLCGT